MIILMNSETFGELVKRIRVAKGLALREVAAGVEIDQSLLSKIERNKFVAPQRIIYPLAQLLEIGYRDLQIKYLSEKLYRIRYGAMRWSLVAALLMFIFENFEKRLATIILKRLKG